MNVLAAGKEQTLLLLLPERKELFPLSSVALTRAQATRSELSRGYRDAIILARDGKVRRVERISVLGPWGESFGRRLLSRLTSAWRIDVDLSSPVNMTLEEIKALVVHCLEEGHSAENLGIEDERALAALVHDISLAQTPVELLAALKLPAPENALDVF
ncbi:hypothetical protein [Ramlibacter albus]|uniref:Uncharacterized protein n=1 Tax=Ramlibacter albus TaxID=2079448 RepID=A0A923S603_9BURK|nr:hypothetical protein [Ramlibacter albus]MBC5768548.1 hypothetical protein [Ramlibacter albus]